MYDRFKYSCLFFPEAPGMIIGIFFFFINYQDFFEARNGWSSIRINRLIPAAPAPEII
jgi:hypothetical protein